MLWLKLLLPILTLSVALVQIELEYRWHDRRTKRHRWVRRILILFIIVASFITLNVVYQNHQDSLIRDQTLKEIKNQGEESLRAAEERERKAQNERNFLEKQIVALNGKLDPFVEIAKVRYPNVSEEAALSKLAEDVKDLQKRAQQLEVEARRAHRGITVTYDFVGMKRETGPGIIRGSKGRQPVYLKIKELRNQNRWDELIEVCEQEMKTTPEWLTPYLYAGVAYANIGSREKAIKLLLHVQREAAGDPQYQEVDSLLKQLKK